MDAKSRLIARKYYDVQEGFGNVEHTLRRVQEVDPSVTREEVRRFLNRQEVRQRKKPNRYNSFVPDDRLDQIQVDIADFSSRGTQHRYALVSIDSFTKEAAVVPLKDKTSETTARALNIILNKLGLPDALVTDEGGEFQGAFGRRLQYYRIRHQVLRAPPIFVERLIRTIKEKIDVRLRASRGVFDWSRFLDAVLAQYNNTKHTTTQMTPLQAREPENREAVSQAITSAAKNNRKYETIRVGDSVRVIRKPGKYSEFKANFANWSEKVYQVVGIESIDGQAHYRLQDYHRTLLRHELLRIL